MALEFTDDRFNEQLSCRMTEVLKACASNPSGVPPHVITLGYHISGKFALGLYTPVDIYEDDGSVMGQIGANQFEAQIAPMAAWLISEAWTSENLNISPDIETLEGHPDAHEYINIFGMCSKRRFHAAMIKVDRTPEGNIQLNAAPQFFPYSPDSPQGHNHTVDLLTKFFLWIRYGSKGGRILSGNTDTDLLINAVPPADFSGSMGDWMIALSRKKLEWGDKVTPAVYFEILAIAEGEL